MRSDLSNNREPYNLSNNNGLGVRLTDSLPTGNPVPSPPVSGEYHLYVEFDAAGVAWNYWGSAAANPIKGERVDLTNSTLGSPPYTTLGSGVGVLVGFNNPNDHGLKSIQFIPGLSLSAFYG
jgi:hypothetical protein